MLAIVEPGHIVPIDVVPLAQVTMSNSRTWVAAAAPLVCTPIVLFAMLRRKRFRPWLPTYATDAAIL
jgi:hypothetical protein